MSQAAVPLQPDGNVVLPASREDRGGAGWVAYAVAQAALHSDVEHHAQRHGILSHPDQPRDRAWRPDRDLAPIGVRPSHRAVALDGDAVHDAAVAVVVVDREMLRAAIIPERDRVR